MNNDQMKQLESVLSTTLARTIDFLKFAEAKNAALLTFSSAWIAISVSLLSKQESLPQNFHWAIDIALALFVVSAVIAIVSFLPVTNLSKIQKPYTPSKNLLFFKDISSIEVASFSTSVRERYACAEGETISENYINDLSVQVSANSKITTWKFNCFNASAYFSLAAVLFLCIPSLGNLIAVIRAFF